MTQKPKLKDTLGRDRSLHNTSKRAKKEMFAHAYVNQGMLNVRKACETAGLSPASAYRTIRDEEVKELIEFELDIMRQKYWDMRVKKLNFLEDLIMRSFKGECSSDGKTINAAAILGAINLHNKMTGTEEPVHFLQGQKSEPYAHATTDVRRLILDQEEQLKAKLDNSTVNSLTMEISQNEEVP